MAFCTAPQAPAAGPGPGDQRDDGFYYDPVVGQIRGGFWDEPPADPAAVLDNYRDRGPDVWYTGHHYGTLNTEPRIASYLGIAWGQIPPEHYFRMFRTVPDTCDWSWPEQKPVGEWHEYLGVDVVARAHEGAGQRSGRHEPVDDRERLLCADGRGVQHHRRDAQPALTQGGLHAGEPFGVVCRLRRADELHLLDAVHGVQVLDELAHTMGVVHPDVVHRARLLDHREGDDRDALRDLREDLRRVRPREDGVPSDSSSMSNEYSPSAPVRPCATPRALALGT